MQSQKDRMEMINFVLLPSRIFFCTLASFIISFINNKRHVRETENILHCLILVDTPFKQA